MSSKQISVRQIAALAEFRALLRSFLHYSEEAAARAGVQPQQHQLMLQIAGAPDDEVVTVSYLARRLALRHHSAVELCKRCEDGGWVVRERLPENRRLVVLRLTDAGSTLLGELSADHSRELTSLAPELIRALQTIARREARAGAKTAAKRLRSK